MGNGLHSVDKILIWLCAILVIVGLLSYTSYYTRHNQAQENFKNLVMDVKNNIEKKYINNNSKHKIHAESYLSFVEEIQIKAETNQISAIKAHELLNKTYQEFLNGNYSAYKYYQENFFNDKPLEQDDKGLPEKPRPM